MPRTRTITGTLAMVLALLAPTQSWGTIGSASLEVAGATSTPTHWNIPLDQETTATLRGVSTAEVGDPLPATITVWVKSSVNGNTMLTANRVPDTNDYEFSYLPSGDACGTTIVAYQELGLEANNDLADDGMLNGSGTAASGFRFLDANGDPFPCPISVEPDTWGNVKSSYR